MKLQGVGAALGAALLFGFSTPLTKLLLAELPAQMLAGLLYLASGAGLSLAIWWRGRRRAALHGHEPFWLGAAILAGGVLGPVLLLLGLQHTPASSASLLLNMEGVLTALLAWFVFHENFDARIALGMVAIVAGGVLLSWQGKGLAFSPGALLILGACACWAIDNNLTQKVSGADPLQIAALKGLTAGGCNLLLAAMRGQLAWPGPGPLLGGVVVGFLGYGVSLVLFVVALRHLGTARSGAYFSLAPFAGAVLSLALLGEPLSGRFLAAAALMGIGVALHLSEHHEHEHVHEGLDHEHQHEHDEHHQHEHSEEERRREPHSHHHRHPRLVHCHPHYPDLHHRHTHKGSRHS